MEGAEGVLWQFLPPSVPAIEMAGEDGIVESS